MSSGAAIIVAIITALLGPIISGSLLYVRTREKEAKKAELAVRALRVDEEVTVSGVVLTWAQLLEQQAERLQTTVNDLHGTVDTLRADKDLLRDHVRLLSSQVRKMGGAPVDDEGDGGEPAATEAEKADVKEDAPD